MDDDAISMLIDYLTYKKECGEKVVELSLDAVSRLNNLQKAPVADAVPKVSAPMKKEVAISPAKNSPDSLDTIAKECAHCNACVLCKERKQVVPGQGNASSPDIMFIGEAPGADEDEIGLAFVGRAGQLLTKMIEAMGYSRDEIFIANICKCRPPGNRTPTQEEMAACIPFLKRQIAIVKPKSIVALGNTSILGLLGKTGITKLRGKWTEFDGIPLMPTYHPAYMLRMPSVKRDCWQDLQLVMQKFGKPLPKK